MHIEAKLIVSLLDGCLKDIEVEYENSLCRVTARKNIQGLEVHGKALDEVKQGSVIQLRRWLAKKLVDEGLVEFYDPKVDMNYISQLIWREKRSPAELQEVPRNFYQELRECINELYSKDREKAEELRRKLVDIVSIRLSKVISCVSKRMKPDVGFKMLPEEEVLFNILLAIVNAWVSRICMIDSQGDVG